MTLFEQTVIRLLMVIAACAIEGVEHDRLRSVSIDSLARIRASVAQEVPSL